MHWTNVFAKTQKIHGSIGLVVVNKTDKMTLFAPTRHSKFSADQQKSLFVLLKDKVYIFCSH